MNPINLLLPDHTPSKVWACGECNRTGDNELASRRCCTPILCRICGEPSGFNRGGSTATPALTHDKCAQLERGLKAMQRLEKAEKLEDWEGWVWDENRYHESVEAYVEHLECNFEDPADWPDWVYVAESRPGVVLKIEHILENACDDGYEGMCDDLKGEAELEAAIKAFNEANASLIVYDGDWSRAVRVPKPTSVATPPEAQSNA